MKNEFELTIKYFDKRAIATRRELWNKIADLQSQLAEKDKEIEELKLNNKKYFTEGDK